MPEQTAKNKHALYRNPGKEDLGPFASGPNEVRLIKPMQAHQNRGKQKTIKDDIRIGFGIGFKYW